MSVYNYTSIIRIKADRFYPVWI